jgi:AcrR family transcriptional regulator
LPTDRKPALPTDRKPALPTDRKPALPTDRKPALPTDRKPALPTDPDPKSVYNSPLRAQQKQLTHDLILQSVAKTLATHSVQDITVSEVARVAAITERTIYRHFPTREDLLQAFWKWQLERSGGQTVLAPPTLEALFANIRTLFQSLDADEAVIRAVMAAPEGREIRKEANRTRLAHMIAFLEPRTEGLNPAERHRIAAAIVSVSSVLSWLFMRDNCDYDGSQAGEAAVTAVRLLIEGAETEAAKQRNTEQK